METTYRSQPGYAHVYLWCREDFFRTWYECGGLYFHLKNVIRLRYGYIVKRLASWLVGWLIDWVVGGLIAWLGGLVELLFRWFIHSFVFSFASLFGSFVGSVCLSFGRSIDRSIGPTVWQFEYRTCFIMLYKVFLQICLN